MKRFQILVVLCGLPLALIAQNENANKGAGWVKVAEPGSASAGTAPAGDSESSRGRFHFPRTVSPLADGYTYTSVPAGAFRALSSEIEKNPQGVVWTELEGVPKSGGVNWQAIAWALDASGDVVTAFTAAAKSNMVAGCPCGYYRLPKGSTKFVAAGGMHPNGVVGYIVPDGKGRLYSETGFGFQIQRTSDGGRTWSAPSGAFATNPYLRLTGQYGGLYGLTIVNNELYTGGEGGILKCDLEMKSCTEVAAGKAAGYRRNVVSFASNGGPQTPATEIFELARSAPPTGPNGGVSLLKWDSGSKAWNVVPSTTILGAWYDAYINAICKLAGPHEYLMTRYSASNSQLLYTDDAVHWTEYDTTGLPAFQGRFKSLFLSVNPLSGVKYMITLGAPGALFIHK
jgi:hypothetical protein